MTSEAVDTLLPRLIRELEQYGLNAGEYTLYDFVEPDALEMIVDHAPPETHVSFQINDIWVTVYGDATLDIQP